MKITSGTVGIVLCLLSIMLLITSVLCFFCRYIVQFSVKCSDATEAEETLQAAKNALFRENDFEEDAESDKPKLLWSIFFLQEISNPSQVTKQIM